MMKKTRGTLLLALSLAMATTLFVACDNNDEKIDTSSSETVSSAIGADDTASESEEMSDSATSSEVVTYTVNFVGVDNIADQTVEDNGMVAKPTDPIKAHYTFEGWYNGDTAWNFETDTVTSNLTLTAKFTAIEYTITFKADGEQVGEAVKYTVESETISEPDVPAKDYYTGVWETYTLDGGDKTVNVVYTPIEYTLKFIDFNGQETTATYNVENKDEFALPALPAAFGAGAEATGVTGAAACTGTTGATVLCGAATLPATFSSTVTSYTFPFTVIV